MDEETTRRVIKTLSVKEVYEIAYNKLVETEPVEYLINYLESPSIHSKTIINILVDIGDNTIEPLSNILKNSIDLNLKAISAKTLGKLGSFKATDPLIEALKDSDVTIRVNSAKSLGQIKDPKSLDSLEKALSDERAKVRSAAAKSLGYFSEISVEKLSPLLKDSNKEVQIEAITSLSIEGSDEALKCLIKELNRRIIIGFKDKEIEELIKSVIIHLKDEKYLEDYLDKIAHEVTDDKELNKYILKLSDNNLETRLTAIEELSTYHNPIVIEKLHEQLKDKNPKIRAKTAKTLGILKNTESITELIKLLDDTLDVAFESSLAISQFSNVALPYLKSAMNDASDLTQYEILGIVDELDGPEVVEIAIIGLESEDEDILIRAIKILDSKQSQESLKYLTPLFDKNAKIKNALIIAISNIGGLDALSILEEAYLEGKIPEDRIVPIIDKLRDAYIEIVEDDKTTRKKPKALIKFEEEKEEFLIDVILPMYEIDQNSVTYSNIMEYVEKNNLDVNFERIHKYLNSLAYTKKIYRSRKVMNGITTTLFIPDYARINGTLSFNNNKNNNKKVKQVPKQNNDNNKDIEKEFIKASIRKSEIKDFERFVLIPFFRTNLDEVLITEIKSFSDRKYRPIKWDVFKQYIEKSVDEQILKKRVDGVKDKSYYSLF